ncbi:MAG: outer membrane protein assembly factor BamB family protein, partial [Planctomycetota bacterium]
DPTRLNAAGLDEILRIIREEEPPKPSTRISTLGKTAVALSTSRRSDPEKLSKLMRGELDWIVMRAMDKERNRRYESASAFAADVERFLNGDAVLACPPSTGYRLRKFVRRHRGPVIAAAALLAVLCLGFAGTVYGLIQAKISEGNAIEARDGERRQTFRMAFDKGLSLCDDGHVGAGMLWLARALKLCPEDDKSMDRVVRANLNAWRTELNELEAMFPSDAPIITVAYSPEGDRILVGDSNRTGQIWDVETGSPVGEPLPHDGDVHEAEFSSDGKHLLTGDYLTTRAILWDAATGKMVRAFRSDGEVKGRGLLEKTVRGGMPAIAFRPPDYAQIVTGTSYGRTQIWDVASGKAIGELEKQSHMVHDVAVSADGKRILTACHDSTAKVWDFETRKLLATFKHKIRIPTADFLGPHGERVVTGDADGNLHAWDVERAMADEDQTLEAIAGEYERVSWQHDGTVHRLRADWEGKSVASASLDNVTRRWNPETGTEIGVPFEHRAGVQSVTFSPDGSLLLTGCDDNVARLWRPAPGQSVQVVPHVISQKDHEVIYTVDGRYFLSKTDKKTAIVRDTATGAPICELPLPGGVRAIAVSRDGSRILTGGTDSVNYLFDTATGKPVFEKFEHEMDVWTVALSADGRHMMAAGFDGKVHVRDMQTGAPTHKPINVGARAHGVTFSPDSARVAVAIGNKRAMVFEVDQGNPPVLMSGHQSAVGAIAFSRDGKRVATGSQDNTARVWDARTGEPLSAPMVHKGPVWYSVCLAFSPDGRTVVTGCDDRTVRMWDVETARPIGPKLKHEG